MIWETYVDFGWYPPWNLFSWRFRYFANLLHLCNGLPFLKGLSHCWPLLIPVTTLRSMWVLSVRKARYREVVWLSQGATIRASPTPKDSYFPPHRWLMPPPSYTKFLHMHSKSCGDIHCIEWDFKWGDPCGKEDARVATMVGWVQSDYLVPQPW